MLKFLQVHHAVDELTNKSIEDIKNDEQLKDGIFECLINIFTDKNIIYHNSDFKVKSYKFDNVTLSYYKSEDDKYTLWIYNYNKQNSSSHGHVLVFDDERKFNDFIKLIDKDNGVLCAFKLYKTL